MTEINRKKEEFELDWDTDTFETKGFACVERPIKQMGEQAVKLLVNQLRDNSKHRSVRLSSELILRGSVGHLKG